MKTERYVLTVPHSWHASDGQNASNRCWKRLQRRRLRIASKHYMLEHSNSRFESILFDSLCSLYARTGMCHHLTLVLFTVKCDVIADFRHRKLILGSFDHNSFRHKYFSLYFPESPRHNTVFFDALCFEKCQFFSTPTLMRIVLLCMNTRLDVLLSSERLSGNEISEFCDISHH